MTPADALRLAGYAAYAGARLGLVAAGHAAWLVRHHLLPGGDPR